MTLEITLEKITLLKCKECLASVYYSFGPIANVFYLDKLIVRAVQVVFSVRMYSREGGRDYFAELSVFCRRVKSGVLCFFKCQTNFRSFTFNIMYIISCMLNYCIVACIPFMIFLFSFALF